MEPPEPGTRLHIGALRIAGTRRRSTCGSRIHGSVRVRLNASSTRNACGRWSGTSPGRATEQTHPEPRRTLRSWSSSPSTSAVACRPSRSHHRAPDRLGPPRTPRVLR